MTSRGLIRLCFAALALLPLLVLITRCESTGNRETPEHTIVLRWHKAYPGENWTVVKKGLLWSFSFLGADLPRGCWDSAAVRSDSTTLQLNYGKLGFNARALEALDMICDSIRGTKEYETAGGIDLGRFLVLTQHSSPHYYQITGVAPTLEAFLKKYDLKEPLQFGVKNSCVADHQRVILFNEDPDILKTAFVAVETSDSIDTPGYTRMAYEVMDFMPNGQLRFAVYDAAGRLAEGSPLHLGKAGKPSKCLWCHETSISPLFFDNQPAKGMLSNEAFEEKRAAAQQKLEAYRARLEPEIDFSQRQDHTFSELLYISFMEPSALRIASEWKTDTAGVQQRLSFFKTHVYEEFPFLGNAYFRYYVDSIAGTKALAVPYSVREPRGRERDFASWKKNHSTK